MSILFINGSPNKNGNTAELARELLDGKEYETLNLIDYKIYAYGQEYADDQFDEVIGAIRKAAGTTYKHRTYRPYGLCVFFFCSKVQRHCTFLSPSPIFGKYKMAVYEEGKRCA